MSPRWSERAWKGALFVALLVATWGLLAQLPPGAGTPAFFGADKLQHLLLFAGLGILGARAYRETPRWGVVAALVFYGACIEIAQARIGRDFELLDIAADGVGALAVLLVRRRS